MGNFGRDRRGGARSFGNRNGFGGDRRGSFGGGRHGGFNRDGDSGRREMFSAVCSECKKECQVPFNPTNGKPVYCSECFERMNGGRDSRRSGRSDFKPQGVDQNKAQFDAINAKLDKILNLLTPTPILESPKVVEENENVNPVEKEKEVKPKKVKKVIKKTASKKK